MKVLVFNKNEKTRMVVGQLLKELSFNVILAETEEQLLDSMKNEALDITFLDTNSFEDFQHSIDSVLKYKRQSYIILSIEQDDRYSKTEALLNGIDDYVYNDFRLEEIWEFDDNNMRKPIKDRINLWIEDMIDATTIDFSSIQNKRNIELLDKDWKVIIIFTAQIISFFLNEANISIKKDKAISISKFIISEVKSAMKSLKIEEI